LISFFFSFVFLQLEVAMKLLQKRKGDIRLQQWSLPSEVKPGLMSAARPATLGSSVLADMDAFFREFDCMSFSSRHAEHFWTFDDVKADFEIF
jgi:hypothetical protein